MLLLLDVFDFLKAGEVASMDLAIRQIQLVIGMRLLGQINVTHCEILTVV